MAHPRYPSWGVGICWDTMPNTETRDIGKDCRARAASACAKCEPVHRQILRSLRLHGASLGVKRLSHFGALKRRITIAELKK